MRSAVLLIVVVLAFCSRNEEPSVSSEDLSRVSYEYRQTLEGGPDQVFPLLCPVREREWAPGWGCELLHSESGYAELGCIFTTQHHGEPKATWVVSRYDPPRTIEFVKTVGDLFVSQLSISLSEASKGTYADITNTWSALRPSGNDRVRAFTRRHFEHQMENWERALNHFLRTGMMIRVHH